MATPENADQAAAPSAEPKAPQNLDEYFSAGMKAVEEIELATEEQKATPPSKKEEPCVGCDDEKSKGASVAPYKVLKVQGKEIPVKDEGELLTLAQKGMDYTQKTQQLAEERRLAENEIRAKAEELNATARRLSEMLERAKLQPQQAAEGKKPVPPPADEPINYEEWDVDPEFAENSTK
jgi:hypothetical protein